MMSNTVPEKVYSYLWCHKNRTEVQMPYPMRLVHLHEMPKTQLMYKYHTLENLSNCLWCQRWLLYMSAMSMTKLTYKYYAQENLSACFRCQRSNWFTSTIPKNTSQSACGGKEHTEVHMPEQLYFRRLKDQRPYLSTNWIPKNIF